MLLGFAGSLAYVCKFLSAVTLFCQTLYETGGLRANAVKGSSELSLAARQAVLVPRVPHSQIKERRQRRSTRFGIHILVENLYFF